MTLHDSLMARVDWLGNAAKEVAQVATRSRRKDPQNGGRVGEQPRLALEVTSPLMSAHQRVDGSAPSVVHTETTEVPGREYSQERRGPR